MGPGAGVLLFWNRVLISGKYFTTCGAIKCHKFIPYQISSTQEQSLPPYGGLR